MINNKKIIIANLKMYLALVGDVDRWLDNFSKAEKDLAFKNVELVICPPSIFIEKFINKIESKTVSVGAQNCFWENKGAFTGEISPAMLSSMGARYVILGHSERRNYLGENNEIISHKILTALKSGLKPIVCVGEDREQRKRGMTMEVILTQLDECLGGVSQGRMEDVVICYEPVWAISANNPVAPPTSDDVMSARLLIKKFLVKKYGEKVAERVRIIYGGSIDSKNVGDVCVDSGMKGGLIGHASTIPHELVKIATLMDN